MSPEWQVITGNCLEVMPTLGKVAHVITDPPYSEHVHSKSRAGARKVPLRDGNGHMTRCAIDREYKFGFESIDMTKMRQYAAGFLSVTTGWVVAFCDAELLGTWRQKFLDAGLDWCRAGVWIKQGATPQFTGDRPAAGFECLAIGHPPGRKKWNAGGKLGVWTFPIEKSQYSTYDIRVHEAQKPIALMCALVQDFTDPRDLILDPFCGSGTTGVACLRLGRRFIGIEKDATYAELARDRLRAEESGSTLHAMRSGQVPLFR